jgi:hypothetical protein
MFLLFVEEAGKRREKEGGGEGLCLSPIFKHSTSWLAQLP